MQIEAKLEARYYPDYTQRWFPSDINGPHITKDIRYWLDLGLLFGRPSTMTDPSQMYWRRKCR